jgi:hypothetical protein
MREAFEDEAAERYQCSGATGLMAATSRAVAHVMISAWRSD